MPTIILEATVGMGRTQFDWPEGSQALSFLNDHGTPVVCYRRTVADQDWESPNTQGKYGRHIIRVVRSNEPMERMPGYRFVGTAVFDAGPLHCFHCDNSSPVGL